MKTHFLVLIIYFFCFNSFAQTSVAFEKTDSIKPPVIIPAGEPVIIAVPTKPGGSYTKTWWSGLKDKIELKPPVVIPFFNLKNPKDEKNNSSNPLKFGESGKSSFTTYNMENGLVSDRINCSCIDPFGNLWFGSYGYELGGGISRFDGKSFVNYTVTQGLVSNRVICVYANRAGKIWIGTEKGLSCFDGKSFTNYSSTDGLISNSVTCITEDKKGNLWFGTYDGGASSFDGKTFINYSIHQGLKDSDVIAITGDKTGNLWFATSQGGIFRYDGKSFIDFTNTPGLADDFVISMKADKKGNLWFGTEGGGAICFDGYSYVKYTTASGLISNTIICITEDKKGNLWYGTEEGVSCYNGKYFTNYSSENGLAYNVIKSITEDKTGTLWFSTLQEGVSSFGGKSFVNYFFQKFLQTEDITCVMEDRKGNLWFGTMGKGAICFDGKSFKTFSKNNGLASDNVVCITEDKNENLWFGTYHGVSKFDGKTFSTFSKINGLASKNVVCITEDKNGRLWFGTEESGVSCYDGKTFTNYSTEQGLANYGVFSIVEDKLGDLWFSSDGKGVSCFNGKTFTNFTTLNGLASNRVNCISKDHTGNLWFGTTGGLSFLPFDELKKLHNLATKDKNILIANEKGNPALNKVFKNFTIADGLPDSIIMQVIEGNNNKIYVGTNRGGICELTPSQSGSFAIGISYSKSSGYPLNNIGTAMYKDKNGIIWIPTNRAKTGLIRFDPSELHISLEPLNVIIQNIKVDEANICWYNLQFSKEKKLSKQDSATLVLQEYLAYGKTISQEVRDSIQKRFGTIKFNGIAKYYPLPQNLVLPYEHNHISFEFAAIEPSKPYLVKYQYILEGYDKEWSQVTDKTSASFGNISEGTYIFKLKARSFAGVWSEPVTYTFKVLPPWYRTWWFLSLCCLAVLTTFILITKNRINRIKKLEAQKTAFNKSISETEMKALRSQMNPHFIFNALQSIQTFLMSNKSAEANTYLLKFSKLMRLVLENSQHSEVSLKLDLQALELYMQLESIRLPYPFTYQFHIDENVDEETTTIPPLILQPFVENAIWHGLQYKTEPGHINIYISKKDNALFATVEDNGVGRDMSKQVQQPMLLKKESLGMKLTEERLKILNELKNIKSQFKITDLFTKDNQPAGTKVELSLPLAA